MNKRPVSGYLNLFLCLGIVAVSAWLVLNRQAVIDWWRLQAYEPSTTVQALADNSTMQGRGRDLFYISDPQIQTSNDFKNSCSKKGEQTIVLGCYKAQQIYLFNVTDERLNGVKEVTAAHEMLHAAYERFDGNEKRRVDELLKPIIENMQDARILELIKLYNEEEPGELYNEMHSILGTEYVELSPDLEEYYRQYFVDRSKVVAYAQQYQTPFVESQKRLEDYDAKLGTMKTQIDTNNADLQKRQADLESEDSELTRLRTQGELQQYNQRVPGYNTKIREFNTLIEQTRSLVSTYNALVAERNDQAAAQDNLYQSLSSDYQPVTQN